MARKPPTVPEPMSSYQDRKRQIKMLQQRGEDLEHLVKYLFDKLIEKGEDPEKLLFQNLLEVDPARFLNDVNMGDFGRRLLTRTMEHKH